MPRQDRSPVDQMLIVFPLGSSCRSIIFDIAYLLSRTACGVTSPMDDCGCTISGLVAGGLRPDPLAGPSPPGTRAKRIGLMHVRGTRRSAAVSSPAAHRRLDRLAAARAATTPSASIGVGLAW